MSAVYRAFDPNLKREVAIKTIHPHLASDPKFVIRFEEEAAAVAKLRHNNIVQVYDFSKDQDIYFMVQELVIGETLQERLRRLSKGNKRMPIPEAVAYIVQLCDAIEYAHQRGLIHRDIKPANIMLDVNGQAILMDFGIVKIVGGESHTATGAVVGTASYMPPELIRGESPDSRSDMYSLGVTLFEMVSGRPPFEADSAMALMMMHINDPVPDLHSLRPGVPENLIWVIEKSLAKERVKRFASMAEMGAAMKGVLDGVEVQPPPSATEVDQSMVHMQAPTSPETMVDAVSTANATQIDEQRLISTRTPAVATLAGTGDALDASQVLEKSASAPLATAESISQKTSPPEVTVQRKKPIWLVIGAVLLLVIAFGAILVVRQLSSSTGEAESPVGLVSATVTPTARVETPLPSATIAPSATLAPIAAVISSPVISPTPTIPVGVPFARINGITLDNQGRYVVDYETFEFTESLDDLHLSFFFDTLKSQDIGTSSDTSSSFYGGPRPFIEFNQAHKPEAAAQICVLVANPDQSVRLDSGNCTPLPDVVVAAPVGQTDCLLGPSPEFPALVSLESGQIVLVRGISPDELWWNVTIPENPEESCWLLRQDTNIRGDISTLPLAQPPPLPTGTLASGKFVEITLISINDQGQYVVEYVTRGFTEQLPGTHIHFFFNTVPADLVGMTGGGNRLMHGGPSPFTGYSTADRPQDATQLCALVANPDHSVILDSGNCLDLP
jgi:serine/threonine protein kinase